MPRDDSAHAAPLLRPGRNCWRIEHAARLSFLVDGAAYFRAVREAIREARHSLCVLSWDYALLYAFEREWLPRLKLDWRTHPRLSFRLDDRHPLGASHHQKVVVIDDAIAFVSGYDLTRCRWDTRAHQRQDPRRVDHRGVSYPPFHDVGMLVSGDCARALGDLASDRWERETGHKPRRRGFPESGPDPWPAQVASAITDIDVAIARTEPAFGGRNGIGEIRALHLDAIAAAKRHVFAENQYFTSQTITD